MSKNSKINKNPKKEISTKIFLNPKKNYKKNGQKIQKPQKNTFIFKRSKNIEKKKFAKKIYIFY